MARRLRPGGNNPAPRSSCWKSRRWGGLAIVAILVPNLAPGAEPVETRTLSQVAESPKRPAGAPRYSDVSMRLFRKHKDGAELAAAEAFHITRADWSYIEDKDYIDRVHARGWTFQGTLNGHTRNPEFALKDKDGKPMIDQWGRSGRYWADCKNQAYREWYVAWLQRWVDLGVDSIQRDGPTCGDHWSIQNAVAFFQNVHPKRTRKVPMSVNLAWNRSVFGGRGEPVTNLFDFGMAEMRRPNVRPDFFWDVSRDARRRGKFLVYTGSQELGVLVCRRAIAGCYATGMLFIVPWDQFAGVNKKRVFSKPKDLADLYGFVRANAGFLDGYEDAAVAGPGLTETRYGKTSPVEVRGGTGKVCAWVRARPGKPDAPVVIHLVDWRTPGKPFLLKLRSVNFFGGKPFTAKLLIPVLYDEDAHSNAEKNKNYAALSETRQVGTTPAAKRVNIALPALSPWGMLVLTPE